jgi:glycosyltransferase involved in cell wall biosynthesis
VAVARWCSSEPMGQELAEAGLVDSLVRDPSPYEIRDFRVTSPRAAIDAELRFPISRIQRAPWWTQLAIGKLVYREYSLVHRLDLRLPPASVPEVITIHDLAPLRFPDEGRLPPYVARAVARAEAVVCPSAFSANEVRREYGPSRIFTVPYGLDPMFLTPVKLSAHERARLDLPDRWVIHSGGATLRKNLGALAEAWPLVRERHPTVGLVLCGPDDPRRTALFDRIGSARALGKVPRAQLVSLVASAAAVVVPSTYEGYGLPALEAMAAGVPLVAAAAASLPEVAGPGAILVDPEPWSLADGICRALEGVPPEDLRRSQEVARSRTWATAAKAFKEIYGHVLERHRNRGRADSRR